MREVHFRSRGKRHIHLADIAHDPDNLRPRSKRSRSAEFQPLPDRVLICPKGACDGLVDDHKRRCILTVILIKKATTHQRHMHCFNIAWSNDTVVSAVERWIWF